MDEHAQETGRWVKLLIQGMVGIFVASIAYPFIKYLWLHRPMDDKTLFETRCSSCHRLPSLDRSRDWPWASVVANMRYLNGADAVISEEEAMRITDYLTRQHELRWRAKDAKDAKASAKQEDTHEQ